MNGHLQSIFNSGGVLNFLADITDQNFSVSPALRLDIYIGVLLGDGNLVGNGLHQVGILFCQAVDKVMLHIEHSQHLIPY